MVIEEMRVIDAQHGPPGVRSLDDCIRYEAKHVVAIGGRWDRLRKKMRQSTEREIGCGVRADSERGSEPKSPCHFEALGSQARLPHAGSSREDDTASASARQKALDEFEFLSATDQWPGQWHSRAMVLPIRNATRMR